MSQSPGLAILTRMGEIENRPPDTQLMRISDDDRQKVGVARLNLAAELEKYGRDARSGVGISRTLA